MANSITKDSGFDWKWLWFAARHIFRFSEDEFWKLTPRQLAAFSEEYTKYNEDRHSDTYEGTSNKRGADFIDNIL